MHLNFTMKYNICTKKKDKIILVELLKGFTDITFLKDRKGLDEQKGKEGM